MYAGAATDNYFDPADGFPDRSINRLRYKLLFVLQPIVNNPDSSFTARNCKEKQQILI